MYVETNILCKTIIEHDLVNSAYETHLNTVLKLVQNKKKEGIYIRTISEFFSANSFILKFLIFWILIFMTPATLIDSKSLKKDVRGGFCVLKF